MFPWIFRFLFVVLLCLQLWENRKELMLPSSPMVMPIYLWWHINRVCRSTHRLPSPAPHTWQSQHRWLLCRSTCLCRLCAPHGKPGEDKRRGAWCWTQKVLWGYKQLSLAQASWWALRHLPSLSQVTQTLEHLTFQLYLPWKPCNDFFSLTSDLKNNPSSETSLDYVCTGVTRVPVAGFKV